MKKNVIDAINKQIQAEMYSAHLYLSMYCYFENLNLDGGSKWMKKQHEEEMKHAFKFIKFLHDRGEKAVLQEIPKPPAAFKSPLHVFEMSYTNEVSVSKSIHKLYELAEKEHDYALKNFLHWFIEEQIEEEQSVQRIVEKMKLIGENGAALYLLDQELAQRKEEDDDED